MTQSITGRTDGAGLRIGIVAALWNDFITGKLLEGALETLQLHGVHEDGVTVVRCPGSFEIPIIASTMAESGCYDAIITLGVIMLLSARFHIPEALTGLIGAVLIGVSLAWSVMHNRREGVSAG